MYNQHEIATKISNDASIKAHIEGFADAKSTVQFLSVLSVADDLIRLFGADTIANDWPVPDTTATESNNPDRVAVSKSNQKARRGRKQKTVSWYYTLIDQFAFADNLQKELDLLVDAAKDQPKIAGNKYTRKDKMTLKADTGYVRGRLTDYREVVKKSVKVIKKLRECAELPKVSVTILRDPTDPSRVRNTKRPIVVADANVPADFRDFTVQTFLNFNIVKAVEAGGTAQAVWGSASRGSNSSDDTGPRVKSTEDVISTTSDLMAYLGQSGMRKHILHAIDTLEEEGDDLLSNLFELEHFLDSVLSAKSKSGKSYYELAEMVSEPEETETGAETVAA